jgi:cell division septation protein DedD
MVGKGKKEAEMASAGRNETTSTRPREDRSEPKDIKPVADDESAKEKGSRKNRKEKDEAEKPAAAAQPDRMVYDDLDKTDSETPLTPKPDNTATVQKTPQETLSDVAARTQEPPAHNDTAAAADQNAGRFTVQVMATGSKEKADQQLDYLKSKGYTAFMSEETTGSGASVYKVRVGKFADSDSAKKIATRLKEDLKLDTWVAVLE